MTRRRGVVAVLVGLLAASSLTSCAILQPGQPSARSMDYPRANPTVGLGELDAMLGDQFTMRPGGSFGGDRLSVHASTGTHFADYVEVFYAKGSASQKVSRDESSADGGAQAYYELKTGPLDDAYLRYWLFFPPGFDFVKGGKLPGLFGGTKTSGGKIPNGANGFSTRYMWRADGDGEVYAYLPSSQDHGTSLGRGDWRFPTGRWTCMVQHVHLNTPIQSDGLVEVWQDDRKVSTDTGLIFRTAPDLQIEGLFFSTFFGGGDATWATPRDQVARFGGFKISAQPLTCSS